jgi:hypothetical protein
MKNRTNAVLEMRTPASRLFHPFSDQVFVIFQGRTDVMRYQIKHHLIREFIRRFMSRGEYQLGWNRGFVRVIDASEALNLSCTRFLIQALWAPLFAYFHWCINEHLNELSREKVVPYPVTVYPVWADEGRQANDTCLREQLRNGPDAPDILFTVYGWKPETKALCKLLTTWLQEHWWTGIEGVTDIVPIQNNTVRIPLMKFMVQRVCDCAFPEYIQ